MQLNYLNIKDLIQETNLKKSVYKKCFVSLRPKCQLAESIFQTRSKAHLLYTDFLSPVF